MPSSIVTSWTAAFSSLLILLCLSQCSAAKSLRQTRLQLLDGTTSNATEFEPSNIFLRKTSTESSESHLKLTRAQSKTCSHADIKSTFAVSEFQSEEQRVHKCFAACGFEKVLSGLFVVDVDVNARQVKCKCSSLDQCKFLEPCPTCRVYKFEVAKAKKADESESEPHEVQLGIKANGKSGRKAIQLKDGRSMMLKAKHGKLCSLFEKPSRLTSGIEDESINECRSSCGIESSHSKYKAFTVNAINATFAFCTCSTAQECKDPIPCTGCITYLVDNS